jgi:hypothetical protein
VAPRARSGGMWSRPAPAGLRSSIRLHFPRGVATRVKGLRTCKVATGSGRCAGHLLAGPDSSPVTTFSVDSRVCRSVEFPRAILPTGDAFQTVQNVNNDACVQRGRIVHNSFLQVMDHKSGTGIRKCTKPPLGIKLIIMVIKTQNIRFWYIIVVIKKSNIGHCFFFFYSPWSKD